MQPPKWKKTRRGKRKTPRCRTGRRHTPNAPDPTLDCKGVPWCISDTTDESIKFTDFDTESTEPSCMPLVYWSTQTTAAINLLRPEQSTNTVCLPYVSTANAAATIIQHAYTKYINHVMPHHHHHHVTTNAPTQLDGMLDAILRAINTGFNDIKLNNNTIVNTRFDKIIAKLDNYKLTAKDKFIAKLDNYKSIAKLDNYTNAATDNIVGDDRLLDDNG